MIEVEEGALHINPSGPIRKTEQEQQQFDHLLVPSAPAQEESAVNRKTRYMTNTRQTQALTKRESVANLHERVTGLRQTSNLYLVGVDKTQSIAFDEIFGKKIVNSEGTELTVRTFRKTRVTTATNT